MLYIYSIVLKIKDDFETVSYIVKETITRKCLQNEGSNGTKVGRTVYLFYKRGKETKENIEGYSSMLW
jgi:hypothetical protein